MVVFSWFVVPYSKYTNMKTSRRKLPPIKTHLLEIPAVDLAKMIRTKQVSDCRFIYEKSVFIFLRNLRNIMRV